MFRAFRFPALAALAVAVPLTACQGPTHITIDPKQPVLRTRNDGVQLIGHVMTNTVEDAKAKVEWKSEDPSIATVDERGRVTPGKSGRTTIVAKHGELEARVPLEVLLVESVRTDATQVELSYKDGDAKKVKVEAIGYDGRVLKDRPVYWRTANEKVCRTDANGQVWPVEMGETDIIANVDDKSATVHCVVSK
jgi:hypothetical protein